MTSRPPRTFAPALLLLPGLLLAAQGPSKIPYDKIDPTRNISQPRIESTTHPPLPEQYIWTAEDGVKDNIVMRHELHRNDEIAPHYFRRDFSLDTVPAAATLYVSGPRTAKIWVNGAKVLEVQSNLDSPLASHVFMVDVASHLHSGANTIAIEAIRGSGAGGYNNSRLTLQQLAGKIMVVKLLPAPRGVDAKSLLISDAEWKATLHAPDGWQQPAFTASAWPAADSLGGIESSIDLLQWNADAGMYDWPGYEGISPFLAQAPVPPLSVTHVYGGLGTIQHPDSLTSSSSAELTVHLPAPQVEDQQAPQLLLDFGRDTNGRLHLISDSDSSAQVTIQYGESEAEALHQPYLGITPLEIGAHSSGYGPKSTFRYALIRFTGTGGGDLKFRSMNLDAIYYPVEYKGSFESSDPKLNAMWAVGAYTAHLCMQDGIWDAPKRDRGRWMGDLDVSGRTINDVFADRFLMEDTLDRLLGEAPVKQHVNFIAGYSAFWVTGEAEYYRHTGSRPQLEALHARLIQLLDYMSTELDAENLYVNKTQSWPFVDWSPYLNGDTPEARRATQMEFFYAYREGAWLLTELNDTANAARFTQKAATLKAAAEAHLLDPATGSYGNRWQTNAMAVLSGAADPAQYNAIWKASLASVGNIPYNAYIITPYYNYYVISAMAKMNHRPEALTWIRQYWGGMIDEGATSFWEGYDPAWYRDNFHESLQADNMSGYRVSLAHGWSSGVTPWLMEEVLGIHATGPGFSTVDIRPDLIDLQYAKGAEPTPHGLLAIDIRRSGASTTTAIDLPEGTTARVLVPMPTPSAKVSLNGRPATAQPAEDGTRAIVTLNHPGHYELTAQ